MHEGRGGAPCVCATFWATPPPRKAGRGGRKVASADGSLVARARPQTESQEWREGLLGSEGGRGREDTASAHGVLLDLVLEGALGGGPAVAGPRREEGRPEDTVAGAGRVSIDSRLLSKADPYLIVDMNTGLP